MGLFDKVKNLFTEEVEEEKPIRKEVRHVEVTTPKREEKIEEITKEEPEQEKDKFVFFDDKDFEDLEKKEARELRTKKEEQKETKIPYKGNKPVVNIPTVEKKKFTPSPIISPVYGVLDKNYKKEDVTVKRVRVPNRPKNLTVDDVRNLAFSTIEDDLKNDLLATDYDNFEKEEPIDDLELFGDLDQEENDGIKEEKQNKIIEEPFVYDDFDEDTEILARKLKEQQKKLDEINDIINDEEPRKKRPSLDEILNKLEKNDTKEEKSDVEEAVVETELEEDTAVEENTKLNEDTINDDIIEDEKTSENEELGTETTTDNNSIDAVFTETLDDLDQAIGTNDSKEEPEKKTKNKKDLTDSELLNLIDTMYEKRDEEEK